MPDGSSPDGREPLTAVNQFVAQRLATGHAPKEIVAELVKSGWPEPDAERVVANIQAPLLRNEPTNEGNAELASRGVRRMMFGALWAVGGGLVTALTYEAARPGGRYVIAWGAIVFGLFDIARGISDWTRSRDA